MVNAGGFNARTWMALALVSVQVIGMQGLAWAQEPDGDLEAVVSSAAEDADETATDEIADADDVVVEEPSLVVEDDEEVEPAFEMDFYEIGATTLDVAILRPLGAITMLGGMGFFVASVPFVAPSERIGATWDIFVYSSYDYTVLRPLGEIF